MIFAPMVPTRQAEDLIAGHWAVLEVFRGTLGIGVHQCRPRDPEAKALVERINGYFETSFVPGRTFTDPGDCGRVVTGERVYLRALPLATRNLSITASKLGELVGIAGLALITADHIFGADAVEVLLAARSRP